MQQLLLNEYFTLTNDLVFKLVMTSLPHALGKAESPALVFSINSETLESKDSIGIGLRVNDSLFLGAQPVIAWRTATLRTKDLACELMAAQSPAVKNMEDLSPIVAVSFVQSKTSYPKKMTSRTLHLSDFGFITPFEDKISMVIIPLPTEEEHFELPLSQEDQWRWFIKEARPHTLSSIIKALFSQDPIFKVLQQTLDFLSDQEAIRDLAERRYRRMQEIVQVEEKAAMRA